MLELSYKDLSLEEPIEREEIYRIIDFIIIPEIAEFTIDCLNKFGTIEKLEEANKVAELSIALLKKKKLIVSSSHQSYVDVLISAALLHNLFYDESDWTTIYDARKHLTPIAKDKGIVQQVIDALFQAIEGQLGEDTVVPASKPPVNSPSELLSYGVWFIKEYLPQV